LHQALDQYVVLRESAENDRKDFRKVVGEEMILEGSEKPKLMMADPGEGGFLDRLLALHVCGA